MSDHDDLWAGPRSPDRPLRAATAPADTATAGSNTSWASLPDDTSQQRLLTLAQVPRHWPKPKGNYTRTLRGTGGGRQGGLGTGALLQDGPRASSSHAASGQRIRRMRRTRFQLAPVERPSAYGSNSRRARELEATWSGAAVSMDEQGLPK